MALSKQTSAHTHRGYAVQVGARTSVHGSEPIIACIDWGEIPEDEFYSVVG